MQRCFESLAFGRGEWSTEMFLCFLSLLPRHNYSRGLSGVLPYRFVNYMAKGSQRPLGLCSLMHKIVLLHDFNEVLFFAGCYSRSLYFFLCLPDRAPVFGYWPRVSGTWLRYLHSNLHTVTVLLLRRMAQGKPTFWKGCGETIAGGLAKVSELKSRCQVCGTL